MTDRREGPKLSPLELLVLAIGVALTVVPSLPPVQSDAALFVRFHDWAIFVGGLLTGGVLARARERLER